MLHRSVFAGVLLLALSIPTAAERYRCAMEGLSEDHEAEALTAWSVFEFLDESNALNSTRDPGELILYIARIEDRQREDWRLYFHSNLEGTGERGMWKIASEEGDLRAVVQVLLGDLGESPKPDLESVMRSAEFVFNRNVFTTPGPKVHVPDHFSLVSTPPRINSLLYSLGASRELLEFERGRIPREEREKEPSGTSCVDDLGHLKEVCREPNSTSHDS